MGGNILKIIMIVSVASFISAAEVLFYCTDMSMRLKKEYSINKQFLVHVVVKKIAGSLDIQVPDVVAHGGRRTGVQINTVNGVSTIKHSYVISFDKEGVYSLGKARVLGGGKEFFSDTLEVVVSKNVALEEIHESIHERSHNGQQKENYLEPFSRFVIKMTDSFVGQHIPCFLYFYYDEKIKVAPLFRFALPTSTDYRLSEFASPEEGREVFNGKNYRYVRWPLSFVPLKAGEISVEPFMIEYEYENQGNFQSIWEQFASLFDKKRYMTKVAKQVLFADQVPPYQGKAVHAVGQFTSLKALVNPLVITEKEVSTVTLELVGNGNFDDIKHPQLTLTDDVSLYQSNTFITSLDGLQKKSFEYVVQPHTAGNLEIPSQQIITFDPVTKTHVVLQTDAQFVVVRSLPAQEPSYSIHQKNESQDRIISIKKENAFVEQFKIPGKDFWDFSGMVQSGYFFILVIIGLLSVVGYFCFHFFDYVLLLKKKIDRFFAFRKVSKELLKKRLHRDGAGLYMLFLTLLKDRLEPSQIDFEYTFLQEKGAALCTDDQREKWYEFCCSIAALYFGKSEVTNFDGLFDQAAFWIDYLQKKGL